VKTTAKVVAALAKFPRWLVELVRALEAQMMARLLNQAMQLRTLLALLQELGKVLDSAAAVKMSCRGNSGTPLLMSSPVRGWQRT
jgi:hypothetical protein